MPGGMVLVVFADSTHAAKLLSYNGRAIVGTGQKVQVRKTDLHLNSEKVFRLIEKKLMVREKTEILHQGGESGGNPQSRASRQENRGRRENARENSPHPVHAVASAGGTGMAVGLCGCSWGC